MASTYDVGDVIRVTATYTDTGGNTADPTNKTFRYTTPDGTVTRSTFDGTTGAGNIHKASSGVFYYDIVTTARGKYFYVHQSTGNVSAMGQGYFNVRPSVS